MRAICCAILACLLFEMGKFKTSGMRINEKDMHVAGVMWGISVICIIVAVILCGFGL